MTTNRRKIILVDDIRFTLMRGRQKLTEYYEVFPAMSAAAMFKVLENVKPDVILLDINMPDVDGFDAIKKLKADPRFADIPVIFLTSRSDEESVVTGLGLGAIDYIVKPFSASYLHERIESLLNPDGQPTSQTDDPPQTTENVRKPCVLAIDDAPSVLRSIQYALKHRFNVCTLSKPEELEECLQKINATPELFLLDFNMPVLGGREIFLKIRRIPEHKRTPIIFLTAEATASNVASAINLGASDFVVKPFDPAELRDKIAKHIFKEE